MCFPADFFLWYFYLSMHILLGVDFREVIGVGSCYSDVDDLIFAGEESRPSER